MFSRVVAIRTMPGKARELAQALQEKILPIVEGQPGFVDGIVLVSNTEPDRILALSFWKSQQDAERYMPEQFPRINKLISHMGAPVSKTFNVDAFSSHKIRAGK